MSGKEWVSGAKKFFVCQSFIKNTACRNGELTQHESFHLSALDVAVRKAERMVENNSVVGAIAYSIIVDEEAGEYSNMEGMRTFGETPSVEEY